MGMPVYYEIVAFIQRNFGDFEFRKFRLYLWGAAYELLARNLDCYRLTLYKPKDATAYVVQWQKGKLVLLYPPQFADKADKAVWPYPAQ